MFFCSWTAPQADRPTLTWDAHGLECRWYVRTVWIDIRVPVRAGICRKERTVCTWHVVETQASVTCFSLGSIHFDDRAARARAEQRRSEPIGVAWTCTVASQLVHRCNSPSDYGWALEPGRGRHQHYKSVKDCWVYLFIYFDLWLELAIKRVELSEQPPCRGKNVFQTYIQTYMLCS